MKFHVVFKNSTKKIVNVYTAERWTQMLFSYPGALKAFKHEYGDDVEMKELEVRFMIDDSGEPQVYKPGKPELL